MPQFSQWITVRSAARQLRCNSYRVLTLALRAELRWRALGHVIEIHREDVERLAREVAA